MRISDWSSDVCSSDLTAQHRERALLQALPVGRHRIEEQLRNSEARYRAVFDNAQVSFWELDFSGVLDYLNRLRSQGVTDLRRSEEHTSELQSLMRISYAVFCLKKKNKHNKRQHMTRDIQHYTKRVLCNDSNIQCIQ